MIDIKLIREDVKGVKENSRNRGYDEQDVENVHKSDKEWRRLKQEDDKLRHDRNEVSRRRAPDHLSVAIADAKEEIRLVLFEGTLFVARCIRNGQRHGNG